MRLNDLGITAWVKLVAFVEFAVPIILSPLALILYLVSPESFTFTTPTEIELLGVNIMKMDVDPLTGMVALVVFAIIGIVLQASFLWLAARTPLGRIRV